MSLMPEGMRKLIELTFDEMRAKLPPRVMHPAFRKMMVDDARRKNVTCSCHHRYFMTED